MVTLSAIRDIHEEVEALEISGSNILLDLKGRNRSSLAHNASVFICAQIEARCSSLKQFYEDVDSVRGDEMKILSGDGRDVWRSFFARIDEARDRFRRNSTLQTQPLIFNDINHWYNEAMAYGQSVEESFTGEECRGRFLDLTAHHGSFLNLRKLRDYYQRDFINTLWVKHIKRHGEGGIDFNAFKNQHISLWHPLDYVSWLKGFSQFETIPRYVKYRQEDYQAYVRDLSVYIEKFIHRRQPLYDLPAAISEFRAEFDSRWDLRDVLGWEERTCESSLYALVTDRLFTTQNALNGHLSSKEYRKAFASYEASTEVEKSMLLEKSKEIDRNIAWKEAKVQFMVRFLQGIVEDTIDHVTRKQARTAREITAELSMIETGLVSSLPDDVESDEASSGGEELDANDRSIYNPKNLPLGPDGKPIPYWQYKLFGLDKEFKCEICGNHAYFGRRAFEKHFSEWRHINALRALRIVNSNHFFGVTGIEDAIALNDQLRRRATQSVFNVEKEMECEDAMGNVMSYKAYQDLVRQGMA